MYQVPAANRIEATERMMEALDLHVEGDYHVTDIIREAGEKPGHRKQVKLTPPAGWFQWHRSLIAGRGSSPVVELFYACVLVGSCAYQVSVLSGVRGCRQLSQIRMAAN
jgi:hypothetical protein